MATPEAKKRKKAIKKKYDAIHARLKEEDSETYRQMIEFTDKVKQLWVKVSPFIGEEEVYGESGISINDDYKLKGMPIDFVWWFVLFKMISDKFDEELKWFRENREIIQMMVKEYLAAQELR